MKTNRQIIQDLLEDHPEYRQRKFRYQVLSRLTDISAEECKLICSLADEYRHSPLTKVDKVGDKLEKEKMEEYGYNALSIHDLA